MAAKEAHPIDLNTADAEQLTHIEGIDDERARSILEFREEHGRFRSWEDVRSVPGIGEVLVERVQQTATIGGAAAQEEPEAEPEGEEEEEAEPEDEGEPGPDEDEI